jgi:hypothetical protein
MLYDFNVKVSLDGCLVTKFYQKLFQEGITIGV